MDHKQIEIMKKSRKPSVRIKRVVKALREANPRHTIGNALFEQIIAIGVEEVKDQLSKMDKNRNHIIPPSMWEHCIDIIEDHLDINQKNN
jgi:hypothetical protein